MVSRDRLTKSWAPPWWAVLGVGLAIWAAATGVTMLTRDIITLPTVVLTGSFLVPVTAVVWYLDHQPSPTLSPRRIGIAFLVAGSFGLLAAALLDTYMVSFGSAANLRIGLIEEFVKLLAVVVMAIGISSFRTRDGLVLGAAVGFGFAALESSGYAFAAFFPVHGHFLRSVDSLVLTELARGVLAPFGHGMWTAIVGAAIFAAARGGRIRLLWVLGAYLLVSGLHGAFDSINGVVGYVLVSIVGLIPLVWLWLRAEGRTGLVPAQPLEIEPAR